MRFHSREAALAPHMDTVEISEEGRAANAKLQIQQTKADTTATEVEQLSYQKTEAVCPKSPTMPLTGNDTLSTALPVYRTI